MKLADFPQIQALSDEEKEELAEQILLSIPQKADEEPSPEVKEQLDSRWERYLANPESALTEEEFFRKLEARRVG